MKSGWLIASVLLNMLLIGIIAGLIVRGDDSARATGPGQPGTERPFFDASPEDRRAVGRLLREGFQNVKPLRESQRQKRRELAKLLGTETYDAEAVKTLLAEMRASDEAVTAKIHSLIEPQLADLTPTQRKIVADALTRGPGRVGRRGERGERHGDNQRPRDRN